MKRFIVMTLCVSTFFIGLGGLIDRAGATLQSDARALELISQARIAIGGDANIKTVRSMSILGTMTKTFEKEGLQQTRQGEMEINMQLPGQFSKMFKFDHPDGAAGGEHIEKSVDVVVVGGDSGGAVITENHGDKNVFVIKRGDGTDATWTTEEGNQIKPGERRVIVRKPDGTTEELTGDDKHKIIVRSNDGTGEANVWKKDDGGEVIIERVEGPGPDAYYRNNEMLRLTLGLILTAPEGLDVSYKYLGEGSVDGNPSNIISVNSNGSDFKLFLDKASNLPQMISFESNNSPRIVRVRKENGKQINETVELKGDQAEMVEHQIKFSDFRSTGSLLLPYRWTETVGGKQHQTFAVTSFEINPANIAEKFAHPQVRVRREKPQN